VRHRAISIPRSSAIARGGVDCLVTRGPWQCSGDSRGDSREIQAHSHSKSPEKLDGEEIASENSIGAIAPSAIGAISGSNGARVVVPLLVEYIPMGAQRSDFDRSLFRSR